MYVIDISNGIYYGIWDNVIFRADSCQFFMGSGDFWVLQVWQFGHWLLVGGLNPSEKYEVVSWDDEIPNIWKFIENIPKHQPEYVYPKSWLITVL